MFGGRPAWNQKPPLRTREWKWYPGRENTPDNIDGEALTAEDLKAIQLGEEVTGRPQGLALPAPPTGGGLPDGGQEKQAHPGRQKGSSKSKKGNWQTGAGKGGSHFGQKQYGWGKNRGKGFGKGKKKW